MAQNTVSGPPAYLSCKPRTDKWEKPDETLAHLTRLSQKPGVQSTLILSRDTGAILRTTGLISKSATANPNSTLPAAPESSAETLVNGRKESGLQNAEDVASMVWAFLGSAGTLVERLDGDDEVKLLRLRMRKNELVIIPGESLLCSDCGFVEY